MRMGAPVLTCVWLAAASALSPAAASDPVAATKADAQKADPAKGPAATPATVTAQAPKSTTSKPETIEEIVARVQRRLAMETARPARKTAATPARPAPGARVTLIWRPSIVWPPELLDARNDADAAVTDRVTLSWGEPATR